MNIYIVNETNIIASITNITVVPRVGEKITIECFGTFIVKSISWHINQTENFIRVKVVRWQK